MDLENELKLHTELTSSLDEIINACNKIWKNPLLPWFTKHDVSHSQEIIHLLGQILSPLEKTPQMLDEHELFILLASAYLHDIGMQNLKVEDISIDKLTSNEYELIRKRHAEVSHDIILKRLIIPIQRDDLHLPIIEDDYLPIIAKVSKGHATDYFEESIEYFKKTSANPQNRSVRAELLTALLMIADELDLHSKRTSFLETGKFKLSDYSAVHWYKHHYVTSVKVDKGTVCLTLQFPKDANEYEDLIKELIETKLKTQIDKVNPILSESTRGLLHLNDIKIQTQVDDTGAKRELPDGVLKELRKTLEQSESVISDTMKIEGIVPHSIPVPSKIFTGRKDELKKFGKALKQSNLISIEGLGGIGKSEFAAKCVEEYLQTGKSVWFDCSPETKLDSIIDYCGYSDVLKGENKTELAKYSGFVDLIERDKRTIILDNFQDVINESFRDFFKFSERRLNEARFILIAREHPTFECVSVLPVALEGLKKYSVDYARKVLSLYYSDVEIDDKNLHDICDAVDGHPLAINLEIQLLHYGETPNNIIGKLVQAKDINEELSHRLLDEIFKHPESTEQEKQLLLNFSIFRNKMLLEAFEYISDDSDKVDILRKLIDKHMIIRYGHFYGVHPLVREFCYHRLENKKGFHIRAYEYLKTTRGGKLDTILEEEIFYHLLSGEQLQELILLISEKGKDFILLGQTNFLKGMMDIVMEKGIEQAVFYLYYGDIAQIKGEWDVALNYFKKSFSFPKVDIKTSAMAYIKYGEMLFRKGDVKESLKYFEGGFDICKKNSFKKGEARSLNDIGLVKHVFGELAVALEKINQALDLNKNISDELGISDNLNNIGNILCDKGEKDDLEDALKKYEESLEIRKEIKDKAGMALALGNIGVVLRKMKVLDGAMSKCEESLKIRREIGDKAGIAHSLSGIGNVLHDKSGKSNLDDALKKYEESFNISEEIGSKSGMAWSLNNIGVILDDRGDNDGALIKYKERLKIENKIGDKRGIAQALHNIGSVYYLKKIFHLALDNLLKSIALHNQIGIKNQGTYEYIFDILRIEGFKRFKTLAEEAFNKLPEDLKPFIDMKEFVENKTLHVTKKPERNAPCPCGSGKRYKKCCGRL